MLSAGAAGRRRRAFFCVGRTLGVLAEQANNRARTLMAPDKCEVTNPIKIVLLCSFTSRFMSFIPLILLRDQMPTPQEHARTSQTSDIQRQPCDV